MVRYSFLTTWAFGPPGTIEHVFDAIHDAQAYPSWWKGVLAVERLEPGDAEGVGALDRYVWKSKLPYELEFRSRTVRVERPWLIEGEAFGELAGTGRWRLWQNRDGVCVTYEWNVGTTRAWMNLLAPVAKPVFAWNHDYVMRNGGEGLARLLGTPLLLSD
jgi:hypothetical protein